jgi:hypothetical protein
VVESAAEAAWAPSSVSIAIWWPSPVESRREAGGMWGQEASGWRLITSERPLFIFGDHLGDVILERILLPQKLYITRTF